MAIMRCESNGDPFAVNKFSGASGLFQHMPAYWPSRAEKVGWDPTTSPFHPEANVAAAAWLVEATGGWSHWTCNRVLD